MNGFLPSGRYQCTPAEAEAAFVSDPAYAASISRAPLWQHHWTNALALLTSAVRVHAAWISGSFTSDKVNPRDIDVVFVINEQDRLSRSVTERQIVEAFARRVIDPATGRVVAAHGLLVDSYIIPWAPYLDKRGHLVEYDEYVSDRGYWDDWWSRRRFSPKGSPSVSQDAHPCRGYLEVSISDYV
ncbi:DUF6932 family protein [Actinoplanes sp. NPDC004185]